MMIGYIQGSIIDSSNNSIVVDVNGVGYLIYPVGQALGHPIGQAVALYIHTVVREQALDLYGFPTKQEKQLFELLITVSGIGPKVGLTILQAASCEHIICAVREKDSSVLTKVSGVGKKNAEKIILELENKIDPSWMSESSEHYTSSIEIFETLETLGYRNKDIQNILQDASMQGLDTAAAVKQAIKLLSS